MVDFTATFDDKAVTAAIAKIVNEVERTQEEFERMEKKGAEALKEVAEKGEEAADATKKAAQQTALFSRETLAAAKNTNIFGVNMGRLGANINAGIATFRSFAAVARVALSSVRAALIASGIGAIFLLITGAVAGTIAAFQKVKPVTDFVADSFAALSGIVNTFIERVAGLAKGIREIFSGNIRQGLSSIGSSFSGIATEAAEATRRAIALRRELEAISDDQADLARRRALEAEALVRLNALQGDETKGIRARQQAAQEASDIQRRFLNEEIALAERKLRAANQEAKATAQQRTDAQGNLKLTQEQNAAIIQLNNLRANAATLDIEAANAQAALRREAQQAARARQAELEALNKQAADFIRQVEQLQRSQLLGANRIRAERDAAIRQIDEQEQAMRAAFEKAGKRFELEADFERARVLINAQANQDIRQAMREEEEWLLQQAERKAKADEDAVTKARAERLKELSTAREIALARAQLERMGGLTELQEAQARTRKKLDIEIQFARARQEIIREQFGDNSLEAQLIREQIKLMEREYEDVGNLNLSGFEILKQRILEALNIREEDLARLGEATGQAITSITSLTQAAVDVQIAQQDRLLRAIRGRIQETQSALQEEQRRAEQGYANDAALLQKALDEQLALEAQAEAKRAELEEKKTRATVRQNQIQAVSEYTKMVISLFASEASKGVVGIGLAIGAFALIARVIAQQKALALQATQGFRDGTPYVDGPGTGRSDSILSWLSRGERVVPADLNKDMGGRAMTNEELARYVGIGRLAERAFAGAGVGDLNRRAEEAGAKRREAEASTGYHAMLQAYREAAQESAAQIVEAVKEQPVVIPMGDRTRVERHSKNRNQTDIFLHGLQK